MKQKLEKSQPHFHRRRLDLHLPDAGPGELERDGAGHGAGWADGTIEPWDFTDIDRTVSAGVSLNGKQWGRPDETIGIAGIVNDIAGVHQAFFNAGGVGIVIGDGQLPKPGREEIFEAYYSYAVTQATKLTLDYQFVNNPAYNTQRGPVNAFAVRLHTQF